MRGALGLGMKRWVGLDYGGGRDVADGVKEKCERKWVATWR
jgi:hypothetical protein